MSELNKVAGLEEMIDARNGPNIWQYISILNKWKNFLILNFFIVIALAIVVSFLLPKWYRATASILSPKDQGSLNLLGLSNATLRTLPLGQRLGGLGGQNMGAYNYLSILKSRTAMESVIKKFDLIDVYGISDRSMEKTIKELTDNVSFEVQEDNYIVIEVIDKSPQRAADMANYFIEVLNTISIQLATSEAKSNREFIEKRLEITWHSLQSSEDSLRKYQERSGTPILFDQNSSNVSAIAELFAMKAKKEIELAILKRTVSLDNEALKQLSLELDELDKKLSTIPQAGIESIRLYRNVAIQQKIVEYLVPLYEQAKIDEQKDVPVILILDKAVPAEKKIKPQRLIIVASSGLSAFLLSLVFVFLLERIHLLRNDYPSNFSLISSLFKWNLRDKLMP